MRVADETEGNAPDEECPWGRSNVGLLAIVVDGCGGCYGVDIRAQEEKVDENVGQLEQNPILPGGGHCECGENG